MCFFFVRFNVESQLDSGRKMGVCADEQAVARLVPGSLLSEGSGGDLLAKRAKRLRGRFSPQGAKVENAALREALGDQGKHIAHLPWIEEILLFRHGKQVKQG